MKYYVHWSRSLFGAQCAHIVFGCLSMYCRCRSCTHVCVCVWRFWFFFPFHLNLTKYTWLQITLPVYIHTPKSRYHWCEFDWNSTNADLVQSKSCWIFTIICFSLTEADAIITWAFFNFFSLFIYTHHIKCCTVLDCMLPFLLRCGRHNMIFIHFFHKIVISSSLAVGFHVYRKNHIVLFCYSRFLYYEVCLCNFIEIFLFLFVFIKNLRITIMRPNFLIHFNNIIIELIALSPKNEKVI